MIKTVIISGPTASGKNLIGSEIKKELGFKIQICPIIDVLNKCDSNNFIIVILLPTKDDSKNVKDLFKKQEKRIYWKNKNWSENDSKRLFNEINSEYQNYVLPLYDNNNKNILFIYTGNRDLVDIVREIKEKIEPYI